jgi:hypothetical protein
MKTKAELEAEINDLKVRVAELEGMVAAYQFTLERVKVEQPVVPYQSWTPWPDPHDGFTWTFHDNINVLPCTTSTYSFSE